MLKQEKRRNTKKERERILKARDFQKMTIKEKLTIDNPPQIWFILSDGEDEYHLKAAIIEFKKLNGGVVE